MPYSPLLAAGLATAVGLISLSVFSTQSPAQTAGAATATQPTAPGLACNGTRILDPFKGPLGGTDPGLFPIDDKDKSDILKSGLPCQENVTPNAQADPTGKEANGLANLQRGFDFYSWRTFIALNSPADGTPIDQAQAGHADSLGGHGQFQATARRHVAGQSDSRRHGRPMGREWRPSERDCAAGMPR